MNEITQAMTDAGVHIGYNRSRRHPSVLPYIQSARKVKDIIDLEKTIEQLEKAKEFIADVKKDGGQILFVGAKPEAGKIIREYAEMVNMPFIDIRWLGGTLTNFEQIKSRVKRLEKLTDQQKKGELVFKTKKEKLMLEREIEKLERKFGGLRVMDKLPAGLFVIDSRKECIAIEEAWQMNIPTVAIANTDCDITRVNYPIVGNDTSVASIKFFTKQITDTLR